MDWRGTRQARALHSSPDPPLHTPLPTPPNHLSCRISINSTPRRAPPHTHTPHHHHQNTHTCQRCADVCVYCHSPEDAEIKRSLHVGPVRTIIRKTPERPCRLKVTSVVRSCPRLVIKSITVHPTFYRCSPINMLV